MFEVVYDRAAFEFNFSSYQIRNEDANTTTSIPVVSYTGDASTTYDTALQLVRSIIRERRGVRFGIGRRHNRVVSIESESGQLVPNIFQLSSGESSLLNLFLSILRDFDLCRASSSDAAGIRGIVVVDEIDLHLHTVHQYEVLPNLIRMFPSVQFVVTTHSPLFVLGMNKVFGDDGFALYNLPRGQRIDPEEFSEFESAYQSFATTRRFSDDMQFAIEQAQKPIVYVEGTTDENYILKASSLLGRGDLIGRIELRSADGSGNLSKMWKSLRSLSPSVILQPVVLVFDCDSGLSDLSEERVFRRIIPLQIDNPIKKGIENLFEKSVLEKALECKPAFIDITAEHARTERGETKIIPEKWAVNDDEKSNLCNWLCENGTQEDFQHFRQVFEILDNLLYHFSLRRPHGWTIGPGPLPLSNPIRQATAPVGDQPPTRAGMR